MDSWDFILIIYSEKSSGVLEMHVGGSVMQPDLWCKRICLYREWAMGNWEFLTESPGSSLL